MENRTTYLYIVFIITIVSCTSLNQKNVKKYEVKTGITQFKSVCEPNSEILIYSTKEKVIVENSIDTFNNLEFSIGIDEFVYDAFTYNDSFLFLRYYESEKDRINGSGKIKYDITNIYSQEQEIHITLTAETIKSNAYNNNSKLLYISNKHIIIKHYINMKYGENNIPSTNLEFTAEKDHEYLSIYNVASVFVLLKKM